MWNAQTRQGRAAAIDEFLQSSLAGNIRFYADYLALARQRTLDMTEPTRPASVRTLWRVLVRLAASILAVAALMMYVAWQHNPQGEFHDAEEVHWAAWLAVGWSWFLGLWVPFAALASALWGASRWAARRRARWSAHAG